MADDKGVEELLCDEQDFLFAVPGCVDESLECFRVGTSVLRHYCPAGQIDCSARFRGSAQVAPRIVDHGTGQGLAQGQSCMFSEIFRSRYCGRIEHAGRLTKQANHGRGIRHGRNGDGQNASVPLRLEKVGKRAPARVFPGISDQHPGLRFKGKEAGTIAAGLFGFLEQPHGRTAATHTPAVLPMKCYRDLKCFTSRRTADRSRSEYSECLKDGLHSLVPCPVLKR